MSIARSGVIGRRAGLLDAVTAQLKKLTLKPTARIHVTFDPFHENSKNCRDFVHFLSSPKVLNTNPDCSVKTEVVCDRRDPSIVFKLNPELAKDFKTVNVNAGKLTCLELFQLYNKHITPLAPKEVKEEVVRSGKKAKKGRRKK